LARIGITDVLDEARVRGEATGRADDDEPPAKRARASLVADLDEKSGTVVVYARAPPEGLECSICLCVMSDPHMIHGACAHTFCRECLQRALVDRFCCPLCRAVPTTGVAKMMRDTAICKIVDSQEVRCPHGVEQVGEQWFVRAGGCQAIVRRSELSSHEQSCAFRPAGQRRLRYRQVTLSVRLRQHVCENEPENTPSGDPFRWGFTQASSDERRPALVITGTGSSTVKLDGPISYTAIAVGEAPLPWTMLAPPRAASRYWLLTVTWRDDGSVPVAPSVSLFKVGVAAGGDAFDAGDNFSFQKLFVDHFSLQVGLTSLQRRGGDAPRDEWADDAPQRVIGVHRLAVRQDQRQLHLRAFVTGPDGRRLGNSRMGTRSADLPPELWGSTKRGAASCRAMVGWTDPRCTVELSALPEADRWTD
jgi:hypothetical protein